MKKKKKEELAETHPDLKGLDIRVNEFGEIVSNISVEKLNDFLNKNVVDKKLDEEEWEEKNIICELNDKLFKINIRLNKEILCEGCKGKKIEKLTDKCGNEEIARFLYYQCKLNTGYYISGYIRWIPFDEFKNIEYLAKGGFGEVHKAAWINGYYSYYERKYKDGDVVLKKIYNNSSDDKIVDILKEVK